MRFAALGLVLLGFACAHAQPAHPQSEVSPRIVTIKLDGMVDDGMNILVSRAVREAANAEAIVFIVDTPGGRVDSAITISDQILKAPCKTVAYIDGMGAISAGALISYA